LRKNTQPELPPEQNAYLIEENDRARMHNRMHIEFCDDSSNNSSSSSSTSNSASASGPVAVFYSVNRLRHKQFPPSWSRFECGEELITRALKALLAQPDEAQRPRVATTLSPVPGFLDWFQKYVVSYAEQQKRLSACDDVERAAFCAAVERGDAQFYRHVLGGYHAKHIAYLQSEGDLRADVPPEVALLQMLGKPTWFRSMRFVTRCVQPLLRLCYVYLYHVKRLNGVHALDRVAHFHLSNGAVLYRVNPLAMLSELGTPSGAFMANYVYPLDAAERAANRRAYRDDGRIATSSYARAYIEKGADSLLETPPPYYHIDPFAAAAAANDMGGGHGGGRSH
jgi:hypothetical protein